ncbi:DUF5067 domain-containing protein [Enterococcus casseliflavus]|uniref:DUF5067 domain-containing protein n=1 Tax=Enterococcus casseliflavus TaxID=37734 RepID=UPI001330BB5E|nr:DUF5067 domain-containing protein [Enterococcus casseliflavus]
MKKVFIFGLALLSSVTLAACGNSNNESSASSKNTTETTISVPDSKEQADVYFDGETLKINMATVKIISSEVLTPDESVYRDNNQLAFVYEVTNDDEEPLDGSMAWIACINAYQETENTVGKLDVCATPQDEKFAEYREGEFDELKPGGTKKYVIAYDLNDTTTPVVLKATQGVSGEDLGEKTFNLK